MPEPDEATEYDTRTTTLDDGTRVTVAYKRGTRTGTLTDAEFRAEMQGRNPGRPPATVTDLAAERLRRHKPGTPYTAQEVGPYLTGPDSGHMAGPIAEAMNRLTLGRWPRNDRA